MAAAFALAAASPAALCAGAPRYSDIVLSDAKDGAAAASFRPATPKLFVRAKLLDVPAGSKVKSEWIAVKTAVAPPNYRIDAAELNVGPVTNRVDFSMRKPNNGWPAGDYRVDLFINGKKTDDVKFTVVK